jgi:signal transducing adaptor molecule
LHVSDVLLPILKEMYQKAVALQPQIVALMKKYADQRAELEHIHQGFIKASRAYANLSQGRPQQQQVLPTAHPAGQPYPGEW